jgi:hypothetical protein
MKRKSTPEIEAKVREEMNSGRRKENTAMESKDGSVSDAVIELLTRANLTNVTDYC